MRIQIATTITLLLLSCIAFAQKMPLSLAEAQAKALELNVNAQISELEIEKAEHVVKETMAIGLPQITAEASFQNFLDIPTQVLPDFISPAVYGVLIDENLLPPGSGSTPRLLPAQFGTEFNVSGGVTLSQMIFNGSYLVGLKAAKTYVEMSRLQKNKTDTDARMVVAESYLTALLAQENVTLLIDSKETLAKLLSDTQALYEEGFTEEQDVEQLQLTLNLLQSQIANAERQIGLTLQLLNYQIGLPLDTELSLTDDLASLTADRAVESMMETDIPLDDNPDILIIDQGLLIQGLRIREQKSQYLPSINGFINHQQQAQRNEFNFFEGSGDWFPNTVWGINLSVPIFSSGMKHQKVKQLEIDLKEAELKRSLAEAGLELQAERARSDYLYAQEKYQLEEENLALAERIRAKTRIKYMEGITASFELTETENQYLQAQGRIIESTMNLYTALLALKKAYNLI